MSDLYRPTHRATLIDATRDPGEAGLRAVYVDLNPNEFTIKGEAEYSRLDVPGLSHQVVQWSNTKSIEYTFALDWYYQAVSEAHANSGRRDVDASMYAWLTSFLFPVGPGLAPPIMQIYWPHFLWIAGVVTNVETTIRRWSQEGVPMEWGVQVTLLEVRRRFISRDLFHTKGFYSPDAGGEEYPPDLSTGDKF